MNQRIVLPAVVIGGVFAALLTFVLGLLPEAGALALFAVNAVFLIGAVLLYGTLMREAAATAVRAGGAAAERAERRDGARGRRGNRSRGGRGADRERGNRSRPSAREDRPAAASGSREEGQVKWFSGAKGYGFIIRPDGGEIFVHHRSLRDKSRREIPDGQPVSYVVVDREKGPQADDVEVKDARPAENAA